MATNPITDNPITDYLTSEDVESIVSYVLDMSHVVESFQWIWQRYVSDVMFSDRTALAQEALAEIANHPEQGIQGWQDGMNAAQTALIGPGATKRAVEVLMAAEVPSFTQTKIVLEHGAKDELLTMDANGEPMYARLFRRLADSNDLAQKRVTLYTLHRLFADLGFPDRFFDEQQGFPVTLTHEQLDGMAVQGLGFPRPEMIEAAVAFGGSLRSALGDGYPGLSKERMDLLLTYIDAATLNSPANEESPVPLWLTLLFDASEDDNEVVDVDRCRELMGSMVVIGADVSRIGICRHLPEELCHDKVEQAFYLMDPLRLYIEDVELRAAAQAAMAESATAGAPVLPRPRKRL